MQKVGAYLLERRDDMRWPEARASEARHLQGVVGDWLLSKGAQRIEASGTYQPEDGSSGTFTIQDAADGVQSWWMAHLQEETTAGRRFSVAISITAATDRVSVYVTLETGWTTSRIMPASVDARCPRIVRELLALPGTWYHGASRLHASRMQVDGFDAGEGLAAEIEHAGRAVPLVIVSATGGSLALPGLDATLEHDLAGLANIVVVDEEGSWALTDVLGSNFSCYAGAVRLYWPHFSATQDRFFHPFWTGDRLRSIGADVMDCRERFRKQLRSILFRAAALSVARPREIDNIRDAADRATVVELRQRATSLEEFEELADSYATDNEQLRAERTELRSQVDSLQEQVGKLEADRQALLAHLQAAKSLSTQQDAAVGPDDVPDDTDTPPKPGDVRFYKKVHSRPTHDVMRRVADCGCENWQGAHGADKARKGIAKIESNRSDWKAMQHCASCTGGGMWRVRW